LWPPHGWSYDTLSKARKLDAAFDAAVIQARGQGRRPGAPGDHARAVHPLDRRH